MANTVEPVVAFKPAAGDHEKLGAPEAVSPSVAPAQIVCAVGVTVTVGVKFTVTVTEAVAT